MANVVRLRLVKVVAASAVEIAVRLRLVEIVRSRLAEMANVVRSLLVKVVASAARLHLVEIVRSRLAGMASVPSPHEAMASAVYTPRERVYAAWRWRASSVCTSRGDRPFTPRGRWRASSVYSRA